VALAGVAAVAVLAVAGRHSPARTALGEKSALTLAEKSFESRGGAKAVGLAETHLHQSSSLIQELPSMHVDLEPDAAPTPRKSTIEQTADSAATKLVDQAFARAMADAEGKPVTPVIPVVPVFAASWEPTLPSAKKTKAAKRLEIKATKGALTSDDWSSLFAQADTAVQQLAAEAKPPVPVSALKKAAVSTLAAAYAAPKLAAVAPKTAVRRVHRSDWLKALNRPMFLGNVESDQTVEQPVNAKWKKALRRQMSLKGSNVAQVLATQVHHVESRRVSNQPVHMKKAEVEPKKTAAVQHTTAEIVEDMQHMAATVPVQKKQVTGEAILQDWMQALGLGAAQNSGPAGLKLGVSTKKPQQGLAHAQQHLASQAPQQVQTIDKQATAAEKAEARPVFAAHWEPKPKAQVAVKPPKAKTGILAEWFAALHHKPETMFQNFVDGGDGRRTDGRPTAEAIMRKEKQPHMEPASVSKKQLLQRALTKMPYKHQQLAARGAWAKALGSKVMRLVRDKNKPKATSNMWGDVLVHVDRQIVADGALIPTVSSSVSARQQVAAKSGDKGEWMKALNRHPSQFKAPRSSMLAAVPHAEHYSTAIMREALEEGETPKAVALELATRGQIRDPFNDEKIPIQQTAFQRTLWSN